MAEGAWEEHEQLRGGGWVETKLNWTGCSPLSKFGAQTPLKMRTMKSVIDLHGEDKTNQIYFGGGKVAVGEEKQTEKTSS